MLALLKCQLVSFINKIVQDQEQYTGKPPAADVANAVSSEVLQL